MYYTNEIISPDDYVMNKTRLYLVQQLQHYGEQFVQFFTKNNITTFAIQDYGFNITEESRKIDSNVYIVFDVNGKKKAGNYIDVQSSRLVFQNTLQYYQNHPAYVTDYCYDSNRTGHLHVIVVKLPFPEKMKLFLKGAYSKMYSQTELQNWFVKEITEKVVIENKLLSVKKITNQWGVLTKHPDYKKEFIETINNEFGTKLDVNDVNDHEFDISPKLNKEILRCTK